MTRLGLAVPIEGLGLRGSLEIALRAERLGYDEVWSYEVAGSDGFTPLAWLAARSEELRLGISLIPAFTRPPALLGMTCAALQELADGRFVLGLGASSSTIVERWMGGSYGRPLTRVRETVEALELVLAGEKVAYRGQTVRVEDFRLGLPPARVPVMIGALGPKMFGLAGEIAAGVVTVFNTAEATPALLADLHAGARAAGRDPGALEVVSKLFVAIDEDEGALRAALRRLLTGYGTVPAYNALLARQGHEREAAAMASAWADGRRGDALAAVTDELLERLFVFGSAADCARRLEQYAAAGVTTVLVAPISVAAAADERRERILHTVELLAARLGARAPAGHA